MKGSVGAQVLAVAFAAAAAPLVLAAPAQAAPAQAARAQAAPMPAAGGATGTASQTYFVASTSASAISLRVTQQPAASIITADLVNDSLGYTATAFDSTQGSEAQAASLYPGTLVIQGPSLLCSEGILPFACPVSPPAYPLLADATYPQHEHASVGPSSATPTAASPLGFHAATATADVSATSAAGVAQSASSDALGGTPLGLSIGAQDSHSNVTATHGGLAVVAVSQASDIALGLLHIDSVTGRVAQRLRPGKPPIDRPSVTVSGVTVAGQAARIGPKGLVVAGHRGPQLLRQLTESGIRVEPATTSTDDTRHGARSEVTGLIITDTRDVKDVPYIPNPLSSVPPLDQIPGLDLKGTYLSTLQLGAVGAAAGLEQQDDVPGGVAPVPTVPTSSTAAASTHSHAISAPPTQPAPADGSGGGGPAPTIAPSAPAPASGGGSPPAVADPAPQAETGFLDGSVLSLDRLYLVMALGAAGLFVAWRVRTATRRGDPWRRGGRRIPS